MSELSHKDPLGRFTGLAAIYNRCRPDYPSAALDYVLEHCGLGPGAQLVDVGCGTGISSRQFAERGLRVLGIEPNADMRRQAEAEPEQPTSIEYREGRAEATGLPAASADAVLAAQAFHWFDADAALPEFRRVLKPCGWVVIVGNERDESDPVTAAYGKIIGGTKDAPAVEGQRRQAAVALARTTLFGRHQQRPQAKQDRGRHGHLRCQPIQLELPRSSREPVSRPALILLQTCGRTAARGVGQGP